MAGPDTSTRRNLAKKGKAMPDSGGGGGRFPIRNREDLAKAIKAVGRAKPGDREKVRRFIIRRARELNLSNMIPASWKSGGSNKTSG